MGLNEILETFPFVPRVGMPSVAGRVVFWSWPRGELAPYVRTRQHYASCDLVPEAYTLKEAVVYLGCWISESLSADYSALASKALREH